MVWCGVEQAGRSENKTSRIQGQEEREGWPGWSVSAERRRQVQQVQQQQQARQSVAKWAADARATQKSKWCQAAGGPSHCPCGPWWLFLASSRTTSVNQRVTQPKGKGKPIRPLRCTGIHHWHNLHNRENSRCKGQRGGGVLA